MRRTASSSREPPQDRVWIARCGRSQDPGRPALPAVAPVPAGQSLLPEPVVAERLVAATPALRLGEVGGAGEVAGRPAVAGADEDRQLRPLGARRAAGAHG